MPRIPYFENSDPTLTDEMNWDEFDRSIRSDADPRESKRPVQDDEWCDEDDYDDQD